MRDTWLYKRLIRFKNLEVKPRVNKLLEHYYYMVDSRRELPQDQIKLLIFGMGRSGSTLLESLLGSTGHFKENRELIDPSRAGQLLNPLKYINGYVKWHRNNNHIIHVKPMHLTSLRNYPIEPKNFILQLLNDRWKIIYIRRDNAMNQALSHIIADYRGQYHKYNDKEVSLNMDLDLEDFKNKMNHKLHFNEQAYKAVKDFDYHEVIYERDLEDNSQHQQTVDRIMDFLGLEKRPVSTKYKKINKQSKQDLISNYDEFVDCVREQGWEQYLD